MYNVDDNYAKLAASLADRQDWSRPVETNGAARAAALLAGLL